MQWVQLSSAAAGSLNPVVVNGAGFTLYRFDKDAPHPSQSNCNGSCAVPAGAKVLFSRVNAPGAGGVARTGGTAGYRGWPQTQSGRRTCR
jgi:predicted lipoprotein with Yx(FWY)xxD motif